jgi:hypothetical protein
MPKFILTFYDRILKSVARLVRRGRVVNTPTSYSGGCESKSQFGDRLYWQVFSPSLPPP